MPQITAAPCRGVSARRLEKLAETESASLSSKLVSTRSPASQKLAELQGFCRHIVLGDLLTSPQSAVQYWGRH